MEPCSPRSRPPTAAAPTDGPCTSGTRTPRNGRARTEAGSQARNGSRTWLGLMTALKGLKRCPEGAQVLPCRGLIAALKGPPGKEITCTERNDMP
eukprot:1854257-Lingulodinium_polyedra.AAC.1